MPDSRTPSGQSKRSDKPREFAFISGRASSVREKSKISQLAHRHTARVVNRQRKLLRTQTSPGGIENSAASSSSGLFGNELHASSRSASVPANNTSTYGQVLRFDQEEDDELVRLSDGSLTTKAFSRAMTRPSFHKQEDISDQMLHYLWLQTSSSPTRCLDPFLGPLAAGLLQTASEPVYSLGIHHHFNASGGRAYSIWSSFEWFYLYCQEPIVFHAFNVAAAMHDDLTSNKDRWSKCAEIMYHRGELLSRLAKLISNMDESKIELALFGIAASIVTTLQVGKGWPDRALLLSPHMPSANFDKAFGRMLVPEEPLKAIVQLVNQRGGLHNIRLPGLALVVSGEDTRRAGQAGTRPFLPCMSKLYDDVALACVEIQADSRPGHGFSTHVPGGLPREMLGTLIFLCSVDRLMSRTRNDDQLEYDRNHLVQARNVVHHQMLSLDPWDGLDDDRRGGSSWEMYECCRLTARLYSTAILWGMPPDTGWHYKLVRQVRHVLETSQFQHWPQESFRFLTWVLVLCGIASYRSADRKFFEQSLRVALIRSGVATLQRLNEIISVFIWSEKACADGAAILWDMLDMEEADEHLWDCEEEGQDQGKGSESEAE